MAVRVCVYIKNMREPVRVAMCEIKKQTLSHTYKNKKDYPRTSKGYALLCIYTEKNRCNAYSFDFLRLPTIHARGELGFRYVRIPFHIFL